MKTLLMGPRPIATVLVVKPSALRRNNLARLLHGIAMERFQIVGLRLIMFSELEASCLQSDRIRKVCIHTITYNTPTTYMYIIHTLLLNHKMRHIENL